jgi:hypothetical protein
VWGLRGLGYWVAKGQVHFVALTVEAARYCELFGFLKTKLLFLLFEDLLPSLLTSPGMKANDAQIYEDK